MTIEIDSSALEKACKEIIETILLCLPDSFKGTVYRIGKPPEMVAKKITSGVIDTDRKIISWGLTERSDYDPPGKPWMEYRDEPGRPLEAMAWCVEKQKSWTAENPSQDSRSVRLQVEGVLEDYHHMEPVLLRKEDLYGNNGPKLPYPTNIAGQILWERSHYVVVAVIKIHFKPTPIRIGSRESKVIKKLSRALGTELLSYQLKHQSIEAMRQLAEDKLNSCNLLADSLRNAITKSGLIFSLIKLELGSLRRQWEELLLEESNVNAVKNEAVRSLNDLLMGMDQVDDNLKNDLMKVQERFLDLNLPPGSGEKWIQMQIEDRWNKFLKEEIITETNKEAIRYNINKLKKSLYLGMDPDIVRGYDRAPENLKKEWVDLIYKNNDIVNVPFLERLINLLEDSSLNLPSQEKSRKSLIHLKTLALIMGQLEENTNKVLRKVLNGSPDEVFSQTIRLRRL